VPLFGALPVDGDFIAGQLEFDAQFAYRFARHETGWTRVFPIRPPRWACATSPTAAALQLRSAAFYSFQNDPRQRFVYSRAETKF